MSYFSPALNAEICVSLNLPEIRSFFLFFFFFVRYGKIESAEREKEIGSKNNSGANWKKKSGQFGSSHRAAKNNLKYLSNLYYDFYHPVYLVFLYRIIDCDYGFFLFPVSTI